MALRRMASFHRQKDIVVCPAISLNILEGWSMCAESSKDSNKVARKLMILTPIGNHLVCLVLSVPVNDNDASFWSI